MLIPSWDAVTPLLVIDRILDLIFVGAVTLFCLGVGRFLLRRFGFLFDSVWLESGMQFGVGMGAIALLLLGLGLAQVLYAPLILGILAVGLVATFREWRAVLDGWRAAWRGARLAPIERILLGAFLLLLLPIVLTALLPPTDNDALSYHLYAPAFFLRQHAIVPSYSVIGVNYPIALDLMYLFGLAAGSDIAAQMMHLVCALAMTAALYGIAAARFSRATGLLACVIFLSSSVIGLEASTPIIDLAWAMYEFFAMVLFVLWWEKREQKYLVLLGVMLGFAASNKHLALAGWVLVFGLVGLVSLFQSRKADANLAARVRAVVVNLAVVFIPALLVIAPWWLKNAVWLGNPLYPFFGNTYGLDGTPTVGGNGLSDWVALGMGHDLPALLAFPFNVYFRWEAFNFAFNRSGPTLFFWFLPFYLAVSNRAALAGRAIVNWFLLFAGLRFLFWFAYAQNMRYLVIVFPLLALVCAYTIVELFKRLPRPAVRALLGTVVAGCLVWGLFLQWGFFLLLREQPVAFLVGSISRNAYLKENLPDYSAVRFMNEQLPETARILALGDSRLYYGQRNTITDDSHMNWRQLIGQAGSAEQVAARLAQLGITHIWTSKDDFAYFQNNWKIASPLQEPPGLFQALAREYLTLVYEDERGHSVYAVKPSGRTN